MLPVSNRSGLVQMMSIRTGKLLLRDQFKIINAFLMATKDLILAEWVHIHPRHVSHQKSMRVPYAK